MVKKLAILVSLLMIENMAQATIFSTFKSLFSKRTGTAKRVQRSTVNPRINANRDRENKKNCSLSSIERSSLSKKKRACLGDFPKKLLIKSPKGVIRYLSEAEKNRRLKKARVSKVRDSYASLKESGKIQAYEEQKRFEEEIAPEVIRSIVFDGNDNKSTMQKYIDFNRTKIRQEGKKLGGAVLNQEDILFIKVVDDKYSIFNNYSRDWLAVEKDVNELDKKISINRVLNALDESQEAQDLFIHSQLFE